VTKRISELDSISLTDVVTIQKITNIGVTDSITLTDTVSPYKLATHNISASDTITLTDSVSAALAVIRGQLLKFNPFTGTLQWLKDLRDIDSHLLPDADATYNLGSSSLKFKNVFLQLPTSDPGVSGQLWNDSGTVKVSV
jgi:hypothetical protein